MKDTIKKDTLTRKLKRTRKLIKDLDKSYYTENGLAFKGGMIHMYNVIVCELLGREGEKLRV